MSQLAIPRERTSLALLLLGVSLLLLALTAAAGEQDLGLVSAAVLLGSALVVYGPRLNWFHALAGLFLLILFVPIRRYSVSVNVGIDLEPYRIFIGFLLFGWVMSLLVDPRVRLRRTEFDVPLALIVLATLGSILANPGRVGSLESYVIKSTTFFLSFLLVFYLLATVIRRRQTVATLSKILVLAGAVIAVLAIVESRTGSTPFNSLANFVPFLEFKEDVETLLPRGARLRAYGPAEHPIALGAVLTMLIPLAVCFTRANWRWWVPAFALAAGSLSTQSRTAVLMLAALVIVGFWVRPETRRFWPAVVPLLVAVHIALPGTLGTLKQSLMPQGGLVAEQQGLKGSCTSAGRIADIRPSLAEYAHRPLLGYGYGTRIPTGKSSNSCILDNQWLGTLLDIGALGVIAWLWLFLRFVRRLGNEARADRSERGWLLAAFAASVAAYAVGMFTFDAFSFVQVTFVLFVFMGLGAALIGRPVRPATISS